MKTIEHKGKNLPFIISLPDNYDKNHNYGLIFLMHGFGANMQDLVQVSNAINNNNFIFIFPNAPTELPMNIGRKSYQWAPIEDPLKLQDSIRLMDSTIDEVLGMFSIDKNRIFIGGFSQGGMMAIHGYLTKNSLFAGVIILSSREITSLKSSFYARQNIRVFMAHGVNDSIITIDDGRQTYNNLVNHNFNVDYYEYEMAHEIIEEELKDLKEWLEK